jgi:hypothetical protein
VVRIAAAVAAGQSRQQQQGHVETSKLSQDGQERGCCRDPSRNCD